MFKEKRQGKYLWEILGCSREEAKEMVYKRKTTTRLYRSLIKAFGASLEGIYNTNNLTDEEYRSLNLFLSEHKTRCKNKYKGMTLEDILDSSIDNIRKCIGYNCKKNIPLIKAFGINYNEVFHEDNINADEFRSLENTINLLKERINTIDDIVKENYKDLYLWEILGIEKYELGSIMFNENTERYQLLVKLFGPNFDNTCPIYYSRDLKELIEQLKKRIENGSKIKKGIIEGLDLFTILGVPREIFLEVINVYNGNYQTLFKAFGVNLDGIFHKSNVTEEEYRYIRGIINYFNKKLAIYYAKLVLQVDSFKHDDLITMKRSIYDTALIATLIELMPLEYSEFMAYRLGVKDGYYHSIDSLKEQFSIPEELAEIICNKGTLEFKIAMLEYIKGIENTSVVNKNMKRILRIVEGKQK